MSAITENLSSMIQTVKTEIDQLRARIAGLQNARDELERAPLDVDEAVKLLSGKFDAALSSYELPIAYVGGGDEHGIDDVLRYLNLNPAKTLLWLFPDQIKVLLAKELREHYKESGTVGVTTESRNKRLKEIKAELLNLELGEEKLIQDAEAAGVDIARRADADPGVILGVIEA